MKFLSLFWLAAALVSAQEAPPAWTGCNSVEGALVKIGDPMFLCLHVANGVDWGGGVEYIRLAFNPKADEYSRLHVPNSFVDLRTSSNNGAFIGANLTVAVAAQTAISFTRLYAEGPDDSAKPAAQTRIYPHLTAIIDVEDGVVKGITWDDACIFCGGLECDEITYDYNGVLQDRDSAEQPTGGCGTTLEECNKKLVAGGAGGNEGQACDLTLYVVWTGSDADGRALLSSANRFSAFPAQELRDRLTRNLPDQVLDPPTIPGTGGDTNNRKRDL